VAAAARARREEATTTRCLILDEVQQESDEGLGLQLEDGIVVLWCNLSYQCTAMLSNGMRQEGGSKQRPFLASFCS